MEKEYLLRVKYFQPVWTFISAYASVFHYMQIC